MGRPLVSILVPAYNVEKYVDAALESIRSQTATDYEVIAVDDCSRDNTYSRLQHWAETDSRIQVYRSPSNRGMTGNWNQCLSHASGEFIIKLDGDDVFKPRTIEVLITAMSTVDTVGAAVRTLRCTEELEPLDGLPADDAIINAGIDPYTDNVLPCHKWFSIAGFGHQLWHSCAVMTRRNTLIELGGYRDIFGCAADSDLIWQLLLNKGNFAHCAYVGVMYRAVPRSVSHLYRENGWLRWEGCVANLMALHRARGSMALSTSLGVHYAELWHRWQKFSRSNAFGQLPEAIQGKLLEAMRATTGPSLSSIFLWNSKRILNALKSTSRVNSRERIT